MCPVNANSFQHAYFSVFGTVEMPENTKVNTFFFCCGNSLLEWNVGHPDPLASHLQLSLFQWGHGVAAWRKGEEGHFRSILQLQSINPSTTPSTSFKRGILGQPAPACPTNLQTQSSLQVLKYYRTCNIAVASKLCSQIDQTTMIWCSKCLRYIYSLKRFPPLPSWYQNKWQEPTFLIQRKKNHKD